MNTCVQHLSHGPRHGRAGRRRAAGVPRCVHTGLSAGDRGPPPTSRMMSAATRPLENHVGQPPYVYGDRNAQLFQRLASHNSTLSPPTPTCHATQASPQPTSLPLYLSASLRHYFSTSASLPYRGTNHKLHRGTNQKVWSSLPLRSVALSHALGAAQRVGHVAQGTVLQRPCVFDIRRVGAGG